MFAKLTKAMRVAGYRRGLQALLRHHVAMTTEHIEAIRMASPASVIDVGANKGQFSLAVRSLFPSTVIHAFEPLPEAQAKFDCVFAGDGRTFLHRTALSATAGSAELHVADRADSSSLLPLAEAQERAYGVAQAATLTVTTRRLETEVDLSALPRPILLKIDVQGGELDVLRGIANFELVDAVYVELSFVELYTGQPLFGEVFRFMHDAGYRLRGLYNPSFTSAYGPTQVDALFAR